MALVRPRLQISLPLQMKLCRCGHRTLFGRRSPDEVELDFARSDAAVVAKQLREHANFNHVYLLADSEAFWEMYKPYVPRCTVVGPEDVFVLYFVGHGIGAQVGSPYRAIHDSTLEGAEQDALAIHNSLKIYRPGHPGNRLIVCDAIHRNQLDGFISGPAADGDSDARIR